jgi:hypothetical protein
MQLNDNDYILLYVCIPYVDLRRLGSWLCLRLQVNEDGSYSRDPGICNFLLFCWVCDLLFLCDTADECGSRPPVSRAFPIL